MDRIRPPPFHLLKEPILDALLASDGSEDANLSRSWPSQLENVNEFRRRVTYPARHETQSLYHHVR